MFSCLTKLHTYKNKYINKNYSDYIIILYTYNVVHLLISPSYSINPEMYWLLLITKY